MPRPHAAIAARPRPAPLSYPFDAVPRPGEGIEVGPGVHWLRMPLPFALDHINLWALNAEYGLSYAEALAWTLCWSDGTLVECDVAFDPTLPWNLGPDDAYWFQSTVLHELGHVRGLDHYNAFLSMQNSATSKYLRNETLYMNDNVGVRLRASFVAERDITI